MYGIKNCNTVKSAIDWLKEHDVAFEFHDYKKEGITREHLREWIRQIGWEKLVNTRGTTWRQLEESVRSNVTNEPAALALMLEKTSVIKRPLLEEKGKVIAVGFDAAEYEKIFA